MKRLFFIFFITQSIFSQAKYDFAIYHDGDIGAWEDGIVAFEQFLNWKGVSHNRVTAKDINTITISITYLASCKSAINIYSGLNCNHTGLSPPALALP